MASLTETVQFLKKAAKYGLIAVVSFFIIKTGLSVGKNLWLRFNPPPPPEPTVAFGKLPPIKFPQMQKISGLEYKLENITGSLPKLPTLMEIYPCPTQRASLLALEKTKQKVANLNFKTEPAKITDEIYRWEKNISPYTTLEANIVNGTINFSYNWKLYDDLTRNPEVFDKQEAVQETRKYLKSAGLLKQDLEEGTYKTQFLQATGGKILPAISLSEADFIKVDIFRKNVDEYPVLTANPDRGIVSILFSGSKDKNKKVISFDYNYYPIDLTNFATYPIKTNSQLWEELEKGRAYLSSYDQKTKNIIIRNIYLAYYDSFEKQDYLQPIIVFEGDNNFQAMLPIITDQWLE